MLVSELIDRTLSEWLHPGGDEQPMFDVLAEDIPGRGVNLFSGAEFTDTDANDVADGWSGGSGGGPLAHWEFDPSDQAQRMWVDGPAYVLIQQDITESLRAAGVRPGDTISMSLEGYAEPGTTSGLGMQFWTTFSDPSENTVPFGLTLTPGAPYAYVRESASFVLPYAENYVVKIVMDTNVGNVWSFRRPQIEKGSVATDFSADAGSTIVLEGRAERVPRDTILQIGSELLLAKSSSGSSVIVAERGFGGSVGSRHSAGDTVWIDSTFTRVEVLNALRSLVGKLYPWGLYQRVVDTSLTYTRRNVLTAPTGTKKIHSVTVRKSTTDELYEKFRIRGQDWIEYPEFTPPKFLIRSSGAAEGAALTVVCIQDFTLPTAETDDLTADCGLPEEIQEDLPMAVAGQVLKGRQVPREIIDRVRELLASQGQTPGSIINIGESMLSTFRRDAVLAARRRLDDTDEPAFEWQRS